MRAPPTMPRRRGRAGFAAAVLAVVALLVSAPRAEAQAGVVVQADDPPLAAELSEAVALALAGRSRVVDVGATPAVRTLGAAPSQAELDRLRVALDVDVVIVVRAEPSERGRVPVRVLLASGGAPHVPEERCTRSRVARAVTAYLREAWAQHEPAVRASAASRAEAVQALARAAAPEPSDGAPAPVPRAAIATPASTPTASEAPAQPPAEAPPPLADPPVAQGPPAAPSVPAEARPADPAPSPSAPPAAPAGVATDAGAPEPVTPERPGGRAPDPEPVAPVDPPEPAASNVDPQPPPAASVTPRPVTSVRVPAAPRGAPAAPPRRERVPPPRPPTFPLSEGFLLGVGAGARTLGGPLVGGGELTVAHQGGVGRVGMRLELSEVNTPGIAASVAGRVLATPLFQHIGIVILVGGYAELTSAGAFGLGLDTYGLLRLLDTVYVEARGSLGWIDGGGRGNAPGWGFAGSADPFTAAFVVSVGVTLGGPSTPPVDAADSLPRGELMTGREGGQP